MGFFNKSTASTTTKESATGSAEGKNPYLDGREEWLERYGSYINRAAQWRACCILALLAVLVSLCGNVMQAVQVKTVPYIVEVDQLGKTGVIARADAGKAVPQRLIQSEVATCITNWRTVTADVELQQKMIDRLSFFMAGSAKGVMRGWYEANNPYEIAKTGKLVHVEIKGLPLPVSADSYRVEWVETVRSHTGVTLDSNTYEATATVQINPPTTEAVVLRNPGGVYITALSAGKVIGANQTAKTSEQKDQ